MAFPVVASNTGTHTTTNATSTVITTPSGLASGDMWLVFISIDNNTVITWPSGWTSIIAAAATTDVRLEVRYKIADGTEGANVTVTHTSKKTAWESLRITGHNSTAPEAAVMNDNGDDADPPNLAPSWGAKDTLWFALFSHAEWLSGITYPTNYTNGTKRSGTSGSQLAGLAHARRELNSASENPGTFTPNEVWGSLAATLAIEPSAGGGGGGSTQPPRSMHQFRMRR